MNFKARAFGEIDLLTERIELACRFGNFELGRRQFLQREDFIFAGRDVFQFEFASVVGGDVVIKARERAVLAGLERAECRPVLNRRRLRLHGRRLRLPGRGLARYSC